MRRLNSPFLSLLLVCVQSYLLAFTVESRTLIYNESYFEYVPDPLHWYTASQLCNQRSGTLATLSNSVSYQVLTSFLKSMNISQPVWINRNAGDHNKGLSRAFILEFSGQSDSKNARLKRTFPSMDSVTVCARLRFDQNSSGISTIFSYSIESYIKEFQLSANLTQGQPVKLGLLVHGMHGAFQETFNHDGFWHTVCVSWSQNDGKWELYTDGLFRHQGNRLKNFSSIGPDGFFIIGQVQDSYGGSFRKNESFSGSITDLHVWDRVLNKSEISAMEKECSPVSVGLVYEWKEALLEIESSVTQLWDESPCEATSGHISGFENTLLDSLIEDESLQNQTISLELYHRPQPHEDCVIFDPDEGRMSYDDCDSFRGAVCQFRKEPPKVIGFPKTSFFTRLSNNPGNLPNLTSLHHLTQALLHTLEAGGPNLLSPSDVHYISQRIQAEVTELAGSVSTSPDSAEAMVSIATNYIMVASLMLEPYTAEQWMGMTEDEVSVGPFTIVKSIDSLTESLAGLLSADRTSFSLSTKNINVLMKWQNLSEGSACQSFKPSPPDSSQGDAQFQDELDIPESELQRVHTLGTEEVVFIHTHYSRLSEIGSQAEESLPNHQHNAKRILPGHLASAVISASVRDSSRAQNIPVAVRFTLSSSHAVEYFKKATPVCVFWNFSLMDTQASSWSSDGCVVTSTGTGVTSCLCNHTTNFAVLMNYLDSKWSPEEELILTKLTFIGCGASLCALVVTLMLFTVLDIPRSDRTSIHKNLFIALICAQVILLCSGSAIHSKVACTLVAALLHLFFMAAFSWMLVEGLLLWSKVVAVNLIEDRHMKYYYLIGWGLPILIVTITLASASGKYSADGYCWLSVQNGVIWGFAGPVIFIIMVNIMVLTRVVVITISTAKRRSIMLAMGTSPVEQAYEQIRAAVKAVLVLLPILGLTWLCGILVPFSIAMAYIFILLNSLQGLFIFLIYGVYNTEIRSTVNRIKERRKALNFSNCASSRPSSSGTSSRPVSYPLETTANHEEEVAPSSDCIKSPRAEKEDHSQVVRSGCLGGCW
ncbi:adhesion G protein-coupled receptor D2 isoform 2-T4 [Synchiropus picturatus]